MGMYSVTHMGKVESRQAPKRVKPGENTTVLTSTIVNIKSQPQ